MNEARALLEAVEAIHQERIQHLDGQPALYSYCVEDRQNWPCATMKAITAVEKMAEFSADVREFMEEPF